MTAAGTMGGRYLDLLATRTAATGTVLCLGVDPEPGSLPPGFPPDVSGVERFAALLLDAAAPHAAAVKVNLAFFEAWGSAGMAALERIRARVPAGMPFIADAKRGDIGSTSERIASAVFDGLGADAITVSPYLGPDAIAPLLDRPDRFAYLLCRTSNPRAGALQGLTVPSDASLGAPAEPLANRVARLAATWERHPGTIGLVVGATAPDELSAIRSAVPHLPFLVPGVGAQGGDAASALVQGPARRAGIEAPGGWLLVNVSRGIASRARSAPDPAEAIAAAAGRWAQTLGVLRWPGTERDP